MTDERTTTKSQEDDAAKGSSVTVRNRTPVEATDGAIIPIVPRSIDAAYRIAEHMVRGEYAPASFKGNASAITVAIMHGLEVGLTPMAAVQSIAIINGMPTIWGDGAIGLIRASGKLMSMREWIDGEGDARIAFCEMKRKGEPHPITQMFGVDDAKAAGLMSKGPYKQYLRRMLQMRARSWCMRDAFPDVLRGLAIREEAIDMGNLTQAPDGSYAASETPPRPRRDDPSGDEPKPDPHLGTSVMDSPERETVFPLYDGDGVEVGLLTADVWKSRYNDMGLSMMDLMDGPDFQKWQNINAKAFTDIYGKPQPETAQGATQV